MRNLDREFYAPPRVRRVSKINRQRLAALREKQRRTGKTWVTVTHAEVRDYIKRKG